MSRWFEIIDYEAGIYAHPGRQPSLRHVLFPTEEQGLAWRSSFHQRRQDTLVIVGHREWGDELLAKVWVEFPVGREPEPREAKLYRVNVRSMATGVVTIGATSEDEAESLAERIINEPGFGADDPRISDVDIGNWEVEGIE